MLTAVYFLALATARIVSLSRLDSGSRALEMITSRASRRARAWWSGGGVEPPTFRSLRRESTACERDECHRHDEDQLVGLTMSWVNRVASAISPDEV